MMAFKTLLFSASFGLLVSGHPSNLKSRQEGNLPAAFFLAGDSTTATAGGWGDGFLASTLINGAWGTNFAKSGATTVSFRNGGYWDQTIEAVKNVTANGEYTAWVTIQFGHNDQKAEAGISLEQFSANLGTFVDEVRAAGGNPILVSSLSRRGYSGGRIVENLANETAAALAVADEKGALAINLNRASTDYLNAIGSADAWTYNLTPDDRTHLNDAGAVVFGNMIAWLLDTSAEGDVLRQSTVAGEDYVNAFEEGVYIAE
ncbi:putative gdsl-like lipase acylhydrolase protein [Neofusicoccum parvum UCRNP2]|uniref:Gdsl-like lipase acylhydrolase n=2 Tax=Neofusicoccum parvum TaxID=310453 RepID=A0ACB5RTE1_9PEZI|nr:putative gdsl-like lipase acylhydrolase protein [Neofusicoccum parvum UCRNP2]GME23812.1 Gdsl-like lipase acylhydrolase [Neofusicoccum parvum]